ncbi:PREDICTED: SERTA domain-containing protein 3 [Nanorana parkeri]|uniref:SERTA domain-containing protein 3 n=1 Tax=Nanorana parkeri TaxID=125878 RepID=UPI000854C89F|nr:PREDICTED: SERTA domain-containing protein 3 [Nanorana parkeri]
MPTRGIKRKYPQWEESVLDGHLSFQTDSYTFFRQSLLNMSLEKFNKGRMMVEPSLRRYVLIANTLRVIQEDIRHESLCPLPAMEGGIPGICDPSTGNVISSLLPPDLENILLPSIEDDFSVSAAIASILKELESVLDESCPQSLPRTFVMHDAEAKAESVNQVGSRVPFPAAQTPSNGVDARKEELFNTNSSSLGDAREIELIRDLVLAAACSENLPASAPDAPPELPTVMDTSVLEPVPIKASSHSNGDAPVAMDTSSPEQMKSELPADNSVLTVPAEELRPSEAVFGSFEIMNSSYLNDVSLDDPFSDIDTSVFEKESQSIGSSLSTRLSASEEQWFSSSCSSPSYSSSQGMRETNDIDNIIEILVGS